MINPPVSGDYGSGGEPGIQGFKNNVADADIAAAGENDFCEPSCVIAQDHGINHLSGLQFQVSHFIRGNNDGWR